jgi:hypothetical protein
VVIVSLPPLYFLCRPSFFSFLGNVSMGLAKVTSKALDNKLTTGSASAGLLAVLLYPAIRSSSDGWIYMYIHVDIDIAMLIWIHILLSSHKTRGYTRHKHNIC